MRRTKIALTDFVDVYCSHRDISPGTIEQLRTAAKSLDKMVGGPVPVSMLRDELLNRWIDWKLATCKSKLTVKSQRGALLSLWNAAFQLGLVKRRPANVKRLRISRGIPEAWNADEVARIIEACDSLQGYFSDSGVKRALLMRALFIVGWYSGLRPCDLFTVTFDQINAAGRLSLVQQKTGMPISCDLPPDAMQAVEAIRLPERRLVFPLSRRNWWPYWVKIKRKAAVKGTLRWLRRASATAVEINHPGAAMAHLGHKTPGLAYKHYVDLRQVQLTRPAAPQLVLVAQSAGGAA